jgi:hypothetical protein
MVRTKKVKKLIEQLIANQLEAHLTKLIRNSRTKG